MRTTASMQRRPPSAGKDGPARLAASRKWLQIDSQGKMAYVTVDKHTLVLRLNIPYRDLRSLEYSVTNAYQAGILVREKAYVINLECVKMIVTQDQVLVLSVPGPAPLAGAANGALGGLGGVPGAPHADGGLPHPASMQGIFPTPASQFVRDLVARLLHAGTAPLDRDESNMHIDLSLPYELLALETALAACTRGLEAEASEVERRVAPLLERLGQRVSRHGLDSMRQDKSVLNRLAGRVSKVKQVLEDILNDHQKMEDMYLARRAEAEDLGAMQGLPGGAMESDSPAMLRAVTIMRAATMARAATTLARSTSLTRRSRLTSQSPPPPTHADDPSSIIRSSSSEPPHSAQAAGLERSVTAPAAALLQQPSGMSGPAETAHDPGLPHALFSDGPGRSIFVADEHLPGRAADTDRDPPAEVGKDVSRAATRAAAAEAAVAAQASGEPVGGWSGSRGRDLPAGASWAHNTIAQVSSPKAPRAVLLRSQAMRHQDPAGRPAQARGSRWVSGDGDGDDAGADDLQTVMWTRALAGLDRHNVEGCEDLLDTYFTQVDAVLTRMTMLKERIEATESCIALDLDHRRNELVAYNLALTIFTVAITWVAMTASIFGQNLYFNVADTPVWAWHTATFTSISIALVMLYAMLDYARRRRLLFVPESKI